LSYSETHYRICVKCGLVEAYEVKSDRPRGLGSRRYSERDFLERRRTQQLIELYRFPNNRCVCIDMDSSPTSSLVEVPPSPSPRRRSTTSSLAKELLELKNLFDQGVLTREQFERAKNKLLE
jgi:hypothetical protein